MEKSNGASAAPSCVIIASLLKAASSLYKWLLIVIGAGDGEVSIGRYGVLLVLTAQDVLLFHQRADK